jgi:tetratricopeptide (TPR) repeat protein
LNHYEEAVPALRKSIEMGSTNALSHADLAFVYHKLGMERMAAREYEQAVNLAPQVVKFYLNLVETYLQLIQVDMAQMWVEKALAVDDTDAMIYWFHGRIYLEQSRLLDCQKAWQEGLNLTLDDKIKDTLVNSLNDLSERVAPSTIEQRAAAIDVWSELSSKPDSGEPELVAACLEEVLRIDPYFIEPQLELARVYSDTGNHNDAVIVLKGIIQKQPDNQDALLELGIAFDKLGKFPEAKDAFSRAYNLDPNTEGWQSCQRESHNN